MASGDKTSESAIENIETVARLEQQFLEHRNLKDRAGDAIAGFIGSMTFVIAQTIAIVAWIVINEGLVPGLRAFDPYPYVLLTMIVSLEGVLIATFVLMKQNRMSRRADQRAHLNLQIDLLAEKEVTKILQLQQLLCRHFEIREALTDSEVRELAQQTAVEDLADELEKKLPAE
jgi:uncharacterized membrane protein